MNLLFPGGIWQHAADRICGNKRCRALRLFILCLSVVALLGFFQPVADAQSPQSGDGNDSTTCVAYLTGIGCTNCASIDPVLLQEVVAAYPQLVVLEVEIYHHSKENKTIKDAYFQSYIPGQPGGVPFLVLNKDKTAMGRFQVAELISELPQMGPNPCPWPDGTSLDFSKVQISQLQGKVSIWTKNRVLFRSGEGISVDDALLHTLLREANLWTILSKIPHQKIEPTAVEISRGFIAFQHAIQVGDWILQWNDDPSILLKSFSWRMADFLTWFFPLLLLCLLILVFVRCERSEKGFQVKFSIPEKRRKDYLIVALSMLGLIVFFAIVKTLDPRAIQQAGYYLPLPVFTIIIGLIDGFNPCNMFVLTCLMALLVSTSGSRLRLYLVGLSFVFTVFLLYFLFMAAWLNAFQYISFISPLRLGIGLLSLVAGLINCKDFLFFKKGISLTIPDAQRGPLMRKVYAMKQTIQKGSYPMLVFSSIALAVLSSLVELPCTAGFPIIYTGILSGKVLDSSMSYYLYLAFYNVLYVFPLVTIMSIFIISFKGQAISQRQIEILKFVGGLIMILLGIILLVNPSLIGMAVS